jgi:hypothetical protein
LIRVGKLSWRRGKLLEKLDFHAEESLNQNLNNSLQPTLSTRSFAPVPGIPVVKFPMPNH